MMMITMINCRWPTLAALTHATSLASAAPIAFDFKDPKGVNNAVFKLDAPLESINGTANGVSGTINFDPTHPGALTGKIIIDAATLHVPNPMMKEHLHSAQWVDSKTHPEISFEAVKLANLKTEGDQTTADITGKFTLKGVTKEITIPVRLNYLKDKLAARTNGQQKGGLLVVRSHFTIKRADFNLNPQAPSDKVADEIELTLSLAGAAPRP
jgi:polyisoprenoid-binding protein YceI